MDRAAVIQKTTAILGSLLATEGLSLVDIAYQWERGGWVLRVLIDGEKGITLDDCAKVSRELGQLLDVNDIMPMAYHLEVSSPGLDRPLKKVEDFVKYAGRRVRIKTKDRISGRRNFRGELLGCANENVMVKVDGDSVFSIPLPSILKANLEIQLNCL